MNPWSSFEQLLPQSSLDVGRVLTHAAGNSQVELPAGDRIWARGIAVAAGNMAYVRDGEIVGPAPDLAVTEVTV